MSLRSRLLVALVGVAVLAVTLTTLVLRQATQNQVVAYFEDVLLDDQYAPLDEFYLRHDDFQGVGPTIAGLAAQTDRRLVLAVEETGQVLADSDRDQPLPDLTTLFGDTAYELDDGTLVVLYVLDEIGDTRSDQLLAGLDRIVLPVALVVAFVAVLVAVVLARRLTAPLADLQRATARLGEGDTSVRADVQESGEVGALARSFNEMAARLEEAEAARQRMTADAAHELRTPIATMRAYVEAMVDGVAEPAGRDLEVLQDEVVRLSRLVDDLQLVALADAGQVPLVREDVDLRDVVRHVVQTAEARVAGAVEVTAELPATPIIAHVDPGRMVQVLTALVDNALRHADASAISIGLTAQTSPVGPTGTAGTVAIEVRDDGRGIPPEHLEHVFERLHRVDPSRARKTGGAGLGLAIARGLVEVQGGTVRVTSAMGRGTSFTVLLPLGAPRGDPVGLP